MAPALTMLAFAPYGAASTPSGRLQALPVWNQLTPGANPGARAGAAMAYDGQELVLFGGTAGGNTLGDTWIWNGGNWTAVTGLTAGTTAPTARMGAMATYDAKNGNLVLFGGVDASGAFLQDTWLWSKSTQIWSLAASSGVSAREFGSMVYDPNSNAGAGAVILFGGETSNGADAGMYQWSGSAWTPIAAGSYPPARTGATMVYDSATNNVVLFGGESGGVYLSANTTTPSGGAFPLVDTWLWNGTNWTQVSGLVSNQPSGNTSPTPRGYSAAVYDPASGQVVLTGGAVLTSQTQSILTQDTWTWNGSVWAQTATASEPSDRAGASMAYDPATGQSLLFGGYHNTYLITLTDSNTWNLQAAANLGTVAVGATGNTVGKATLTFQAENGSVVFGTGGLSGTNTPVSVLTQGAANLDYTLGATTCSGTLAANASCTVTVNVSPKYPGVRNGAVQLVDGSGNTLATTLVYGMGSGPTVVFPGNTSTVTLGSGFSYPSGVAVDAAGNVYVADYGNSTVKEMVAVGGSIPASPTIRTLGSGFNVPFGVAVDGAGNVYVADTSNNAVKEMVAVGGSVPASPTIRTLGSGFNVPIGAVVDGAGNVYVVDYGNNAVKEMMAVGGSVPASPTIRTLSSGFNFPYGVAVDGAGNVYVADAGNNAVKELVAVGGSVPASPTTLTLGSGFNSPVGVAVDGAGNVYVGDFNNRAVKAIPLTTPPSLGFGSVTDGNSSAAQTLAVQNIGNAALTLPAPGAGQDPSLSANFLLGNSSTCPLVYSTLTGAGSLAAGSSCTESISFAPAANTLTGTVSGSLVFTDNSAASSTQTVPLNGSAVNTGASSLSITNAPTTAYVNAPFQFTVNALDANNNVNPGYAGMVSFSSPDGGATLPGTYTFTSGDAGSHTFTATLVTAGNQKITVADSGNGLSVQMGVGVSVPGLVVTTAVDDGSPSDHCGSSPTNGPTACRAQVLMTEIANCPVGNSPASTSCSLRDALEAATALGSGSITFDPTVFATAKTISLLTVQPDNTITYNSPLSVTGYTTVLGPRSSTGALLVSVDGSNQGQVFNVAGNGITLDSLIIQHGNAGSGGGLELSSGSVTVSNSTLTGNSANYGGAVDVDSGTLTVSNSTLSNNVATGSSGIGGAMNINSGTTTIRNSTLSGNMANGSNGSGGGIYNNVGNLTISNSTFYGNKAVGLYGGGIVVNGGTVAVYHSTFAGNSVGGYGPDIDAFAGPNLTNSVNLVNSIATDGINGYINSVNTITSGANLSALGNYGGPTQTLLPLPGSTALCAGVVSNLSPAPATNQGFTDQRGATHSATYCSASQLDAGAVQTSYAIGFVQQPTNTIAGQSIAPLPTVSVSENTYVENGTIAMTASAGTLSGTTSQASTSGVATFSGLSISPGATNETLTATLVLNSATNPATAISTTSNTFNVTVPTPTVTMVSPAGGATTGGSLVTITGTNFVSPATVKFGNTAATNVSVTNSTTITATSPAGTGVVDVTVTTSNGTSMTGTADQFTYYAPQSYTVTTLTDDSTGVPANCPSGVSGGAACTLRDAIAAANALPSGVTATIGFASALTSAASAASPAVYTISGPNAPNGGATLNITSNANVTIQGPTSGSGGAQVNLLAIDGGRTTTSSGVPVFNINTSGSVTLNNLIVQNGAIFMANGAGLSIGGTGNVTISNSTVTGNLVSTSNSGAGGGIFVSGGTVSLIQSTVSNNSCSAEGAACQGGGIAVSGGAVTVSNSTLSGNSASVGHSPGSVAQGGGVYINGGTLTVSNSTLSGNGVSANPPSSTSQAGGIYVGGGTVNLYNSILTDSTSGTIGGSNNITSSANLSGLGNNGGPTQTMVPLPGSTAICAGAVSNVSPAPGTNQAFTDQRGVTHSSAYCSASQLDAGAVQTGYAIGFGQQPTNTVAGQTITPSPTVSVTENGLGQSGDGVGMTASAGTLLGPIPQATNTNGVATFSGLSITPAATNETLTGTLTLNAATNPATAISATSGMFNVTVPAPTVTGVSPNGGPVGGGGLVTITGTNFVNGATVKFGNVAATNVNVANATMITATAPASAVNSTSTVDVTVSTTNGTSTTSSADRFTYYTPQTYLVTTLTDDTQANANANYASLCPANLAVAGCSLRDALAAVNALPPGVVATVGFAGALTATATQAGPAVYTATTGGTLTFTGGALLTVNGPLSAGGSNLLAIDGGGSVAVLSLSHTGSVTLNNLIVQNGSSGGTGGGLSMGGAGSLAVNACTFQKNAASSGGGGMEITRGTVTVANSTFSQNGATSPGSSGGGLEVSRGTVTVTNSTFYRNTASQNSGYGGGLYVNLASGSVTVTNSTFSNNQAGGGGVSVSSGPLNLINDIVTDYISGSYTDGGGNVLGSAIKLSPLGNYGGPTQTMVPLTGSGALCFALVSNLSPAPANNQAFTDQRGATHSAGYCTSSQLDAGAVQTSYSLGSAFTTQPPSVVSPGTAITPNPAVTVTENGAGIGGVAVAMSAATGTLTGTLSVNSTAATGLTTFSNLLLTGALPGDSLTATVTLTPSYKLTLNSSTFSSLTLSAPVTLTGQAGVAYSQSVTAANGSGNYSYAVTSAAQLPSGLSLNTTTGAITGTPKAVGSFTVTVMVTDTTSSATASATFMLQIAAPAIVVSTVPTTFPTLTVGVTPVLSFSATGGTSTYAYSYTGTLPAGLTLSASGGVSGTPTTATTYNFTVTAKDSTAGAGAPYSGSQAYSVAVGKGTTTVSFTPASLTPTYAGVPLPVAATISTGGIPLSELTITYTGTGSTTYGPSTTPPTSAGTYSVSAVLSDANYTGTAGPAVFTIGKATPVVAWSNPAAITYGTALGAAQLNATATGVGGAALPGTFLYTPAATTVLNAGANQALSVGFTPADAVDYNNAGAQVSITVNPAQPTLAFSTIAAHTYGDPAFLVSTTSVSTGAVTYGLQTGPATIGSSSGLVTLTGAGQVTLTATQAATSNYLSAVATPVTFNVAKQPSAVSVGLSASSITPLQTVTLTATVSPTVTGSLTPTQTVTFYDGSTIPATQLGVAVALSGGTAQLANVSLVSGAHMIYAVYSGDGNYLTSTSSTSASTTVTVAPEDFVFTPTGLQSQSVIPGSAGVFTFSVTPLYDKYPGVVTFAVTGLPAGATYTVMPTSIPVNGGPQTVTVTIQTPPAVAMRTRQGVFWTMALLLPLAMVSKRRRSRLAKAVTLLLLLVAGAWSISGCGAASSGNGFFGQQAKNYTLTITGTSGAVSHSTTVTLQVQ